MGSQSQGEEKDRGGREIWAREAVALGPCFKLSPFFLFGYPQGGHWQ